MKTKKIMAVALAALMLFGSAISFTGCNKKNSDAVVVKADDPWFSGKRVKLMDGVKDKDKYENILFNDPQVNGDYIIASMTGYRSDPDTGNYYHDDLLYIYDLNGDLKKEIDMSSVISNTGSSSSYTNLFGTTIEAGKVAVYFSVSDYMSGKTELSKVTVDIDSGEISSPENVDIDLKAGENVGNVTFFNEYSIIAKGSSNGVFLYFFKDGEKLFEKDISNDVKTDYPYVTNATMEDGKLKIDIFDDVGSNTFEIDFDKQEVNRTESKVIYYMSSSEITGEDGKTYTAKRDGVYVDDELYFLYGDSDVNISYLAESQLLSANEKNMVFYQQNFDQLKNEPEYYIITLEKKDKNPNEGKVVLNATAAYYNVDEMTAEGIRQFNEKSDKYFVRTSCKSITDMEGFDIGDDDSYIKYEDSFKMDLMSADAPDIIFGCDGISGIDNDDYLMDLKKEIDLSPDVYYTTVTEQMENNGKLYCLPLSFCASGILTDKKYVGDAKGFTFDEYSKFVDEVCNGSDPLGDMYSKEDYLNECLFTIADEIINDGKVDFHQDSFRQLAEYIKDNVPEQAKLQDDDGIIYYDSDYMIERANAPAKYTTVYSISNLIVDAVNFKDPILLGVPSTDRHSCSAYSSMTVGVNVSSDNKEACVEFIKTLLGTDIQKLSTAIPINREALDYLIDDTVDKMNKTYDKYMSMGYYTPNDLIMMEICKPQDGIKETFAETIENVESSKYFDSAVSTIIAEEAREYFSGQKDMDSFLDSLENRVQTVYNEKG